MKQFKQRVSDFKWPNRTVSIDSLCEFVFGFPKNAFDRDRPVSSVADFPHRFQHHGFVGGECCDRLRCIVCAMRVEFHHIATRSPFECILPWHRFYVVFVGLLGRHMGPPKSHFDCCIRRIRFLDRGGIFAQFLCDSAVPISCRCNVSVEPIPFVFSFVPKLNFFSIRQAGGISSCI